MKPNAFRKVLLLAAASGSAAFAQTTAAPPRDFGNWYKAYQENIRRYGSSSGFPLLFEFSVLTGGQLAVVAVQSDGGAGAQANNSATRASGYLASIIPTPGLCSASTTGTAGVRCAADAHFSVTGQGEQLNQSAPLEGAQSPHREAVTSANSGAPLPTFRMLPFPPVYPDRPATLPPQPCDASHDTPLIVVMHQSARVEVIGRCSGKSLARIPVTSNPLQVEILPDNSQALVTSFDSAITFIDLTTYQIKGTMQLPPTVFPAGISISPDGTRAYVVSLDSPGTLLTIDIAKKQILSTLTLGDFPEAVFLSPDGSLAWVVLPFIDEVDVIDTLTNTFVKRMSVREPFGVAFNSTGTLAFISLYGSRAVDVLNTTTYARVTTIPTGSGPVEIGIAPDDSFGVVTNSTGGSLTIFSLYDFTTTTVNLPGAPFGLSMRY